MAGGMPLAFTQEDFLVYKVIVSDNQSVWHYLYRRYKPEKQYIHLQLDTPDQ